MIKINKLFLSAIGKTKGPKRTSRAKAGELCLGDLYHFSGMPFSKKLLTVIFSIRAAQTKTALQTAV